MLHSLKVELFTEISTDLQTVWFVKNVTHVDTEYLDILKMMVLLPKYKFYLLFAAVISGDTCCTGGEWLRGCVLSQGTHTRHTIWHRQPPLKLAEFIGVCVSQN